MQTEFPVPTQGEHNDLPDNELPVTAMRVCQNMVRNERGRLALRPGYGRLGNVSPTDRIMGIGHFRTVGATDKFVTGTFTKLWAYNESATNWEDKTGTALSGSASDHVSFVSMEVGGSFRTIAMNGINPTQWWD